MYKILSFLLVTFLVFGNSYSQQIPKKPKPPKLVNDYAHILSPKQVKALEKKLTKFDDSTSNQVAVVIISTIGNYEIEDYSLKVLRTWGIGSKKNNNGVLLLAAIKDRKVRIETGYGLEGAIPDAIASRIITNNIKPNFKAGNYYQGINEATDSLMAAAIGEYNIPREEPATEKSYSAPATTQGQMSFMNPGEIAALIIFIVVLVMIVLIIGKIIHIIIRMINGITQSDSSTIITRNGQRSFSYRTDNKRTKDISNNKSFWNGIADDVLNSISSSSSSKDSSSSSSWNSGSSDSFWGSDSSSGSSTSSSSSSSSDSSGFGGFGGGSGGGGGASGSW